MVDEFIIISAEEARDMTGHKNVVNERLVALSRTIRVVSGMGNRSVRVAGLSEEICHDMSQRMRRLGYQCEDEAHGVLHVLVVKW